MYAPLHYEVPEVEPDHSPPRSLFGRLCEGVNRVFERLLRSPGYEAWRAVEAQLAAREAFPSAGWSELGVPDTISMAVLDTLRDRNGWPNHHFLPGDPLGLLLISPCYDLRDLHFLLDLRDRFGITYSEAELGQAYAENRTLGAFVQDVVRRIASRQASPPSAQDARSETVRTNLHNKSPADR